MADRAYLIINGNVAQKEEVSIEEALNREKHKAESEIITYECCGKQHGKPCPAKMVIVAKESEYMVTHFKVEDGSRHLIGCCYNTEKPNKVVILYTRNPEKINLREICEKFSKAPTASKVMSKEPPQKKKNTRSDDEEWEDRADKRDIEKKYRNVNSLVEIYKVAKNITKEAEFDEGVKYEEGIVDSRTYHMFSRGGKNKIKGHMMVVAKNTNNKGLYQKIFQMPNKYEWTLEDPYRGGASEKIYYVINVPDFDVFDKIKRKYIDKVFGKKLLVLICDWEAFECEETSGHLVYKGKITGERQIAMIDEIDSEEDPSCLG